jgi:3-hydroxybutyryl-CoA dehydrogenase
MADTRATSGGQDAIGVVGAGTMGSGIAVVALRAGFPTWVCETDAESLDAGIGRIRAFLDGSVRRGKITAAERDAMLTRLHGTTVLEDLASCRYVIEAVYEDVEVKRTLFRRLHAAAAADALFLTNTSTLSVTSIAASTGHEERLVGMHFCNPAPLMALVEISPGLRTSPAALEEAQALAGRLGKTYVVTHDTPGFILNYFLIPFENDCIRALEEGLASVEDIDRAVKLGLGYPMGTFELLDTVGLDVHYAVSMRLYEQLHDPRFAPPPLVRRMIDANRLGRKTGHGFYRYEQGRVFGA